MNLPCTGKGNGFEMESFPTTKEQMLDRLTYISEPSCKQMNSNRLVALIHQPVRYNPQNSLIFPSYMHKHNKLNVY
uniref:Uncharacterized protein n=1 Tax=Rhizophora mucronata TaxID=61149 RepID=A0A2P2J3L4_RHIMU